MGLPILNLVDTDKYATDKDVKNLKIKQFDYFLFL